MGSKNEHRLVFFEHNGPNGPWSCGYCFNEVIITQLLVHHIDEDHSNNNPKNLTAIHRGCHASIHRINKPGLTLGYKHSDETKQKMSAAHLKANQEGRGAKHFPGRNKKIGDALRGRPGHAQTQEAKRKIGISSRERRLIEHVKCDHCELTSNAGAIARHKRAVREQKPSYVSTSCTCGKGPFTTKRAFSVHQTWCKGIRQ